jgi:hypothetical protein
MRAVLAPATAGIVILVAASPAWAVPSYTRQTGDPCSACHIGGYGPALTPHGRAFKLGGYSDGKTVVPLSATILASVTHTAKDQSEAPEHFSRNDNAALQEIVGFVAGRIAPHAGAFIGVAYSGIERKTALDHFDARYAQPLKLGGKDAILGFSVNNNPGSQDVFDSLPAWAFPHEAPELVPERLGMPLLAEGLEGQVAGLSSYLWFDDSIYAEVAGYRSLSHGLLNTIGVADEAGRIAGVAPYVRLAYQKDWGKQVASIGLVGMRAAIHPERQPGPTNKYADWGLDATYQYLGNRKNIVNANLGFLHERQTRDFDFLEGTVERRKHTLNSLSGNVSYTRNNTYGLTLGLFHSWGTRDRGLFAPEEDGGSRTGKPDTTGYILEADWITFARKDGARGGLKVGIQYTGYLRFNGARRTYDGFGRDASDNNSLFGFAAVAF